VSAICVRTDPVVEVELEGSINISSATELKEKLGIALGAGKDLSVLLGRCSGVDITAIQLLWAAARSARMAGLRFHYAEPVPDRLLATLAEAGIDRASFLKGEL
jgi:anti-anti-sigma regulatory factor